MNVFSNFGKSLKKFKNFLFKTSNTPSNKDNLNMSNHSDNHPGVVKKSYSPSEVINLNMLPETKKFEEISKLNLSNNLQSHTLDNTNNKYMNMLLFGTRTRLGSSKILNKEEKKTKSDSKTNKELMPNQLKNRVCAMSLPANDPIEDAYNAIQLKSFGGYFLSVFDGHGGSQIAEYANKELYRKFDESFKDLEDLQDFTFDEKINLALNNAFEITVINIFLISLGKRFIQKGNREI